MSAPILTEVQPAVRVLVRREIRGYARSALFRLGAALTAVVTVVGYVQDDGTSSTMAVIVPAALLGVLGLVVMSGLVRRSDAAAAAAGVVAVEERGRTLALAAASVVPVTAALLWYVAALVQLRVQPPDAGAVPFGPLSYADVTAVMFALGVLPALGGPLLGLLAARWWPRRGVTALTVVGLVLVTIVLQGNFEATWHWRVVWPWTYWYGPVGWDQTGAGDAHWHALPGSPWPWLGYLLALCALGVVGALAHDPQAERRRVLGWAAALGGAAAVLLVLTLTMGLDHAVSNPHLGPSF